MLTIRRHGRICQVCARETADRQVLHGDRLVIAAFATEAEAIRFAIEDFPAVHTLRAWMQVGEERFDYDDIQRLYHNCDYPLQRRSFDERNS